MLRLVLVDAVRIHFAYTAYTVRIHSHVHPASLHHSRTSLVPSHLSLSIGAHIPIRSAEPRGRAREHSGIHRPRPPPTAAIAHARRGVAAVPEGGQGTPQP